MNDFNNHYEPVEAGGIGAELINFFLRKNAKQLENGGYEPRTLRDFLDRCSRLHKHQYQHPLGYVVRPFCHNLMAQGILFSVGFNPNQAPPFNEQFVSFRFDHELAAYGSYDFAALGLVEVRRHFEHSVIRLGVKKEENENEMSGTGFLIENNRLVTAAHCLPPGSVVTIDGWNPRESPLLSIKTREDYDTARPMVPTRSKIDLAVLQFASDPFPRKVDLAVLQFASDPFPQAAKFRFWEASVLDDVLVMGYPQMLGFKPVLIASSGQVVGMHMSTARNQPLVLVDARVKGGNSGGPVLNRLGKVVGVITNALTDEEENIDRLGYGLATPVQALIDLLEDCDANSEKVYNIHHEVDESHIKIQRR